MFRYSLSAFQDVTERIFSQFSSKNILLHTIYLNEIFLYAFLLHELVQKQSECATALIHMGSSACQIDPFRYG